MKIDELAKYDNIIDKVDTRKVENVYGTEAEEKNTVPEHNCKRDQGIGRFFDTFA